MRHHERAWAVRDFKTYTDELLRDPASLAGMLGVGKATAYRWLEKDCPYGYKIALELMRLNPGVFSDVIKSLHAGGTTTPVSNGPGRPPKKTARVVRYLHLWRQELDSGQVIHRAEVADADAPIIPEVRRQYTYLGQYWFNLNPAIECNGTWVVTKWYASEADAEGQINALGADGLPHAGW